MGPPRTGFGMEDMVEVVELAFKERGEGFAEMPPKHGIHPGGDAFIHPMPAYLRRLKAAGIKWVSGYPDNWRQKLPYIMGLIILNDPETGTPFCVMDCTWITAQRTAAATAVAAKYLAKKNSRVIGVIGCGVQGKSNPEAVKCSFPSLDEVRAYDIDWRKCSEYVEEMQKRLGIKVVGVKEPRLAVEGCDIIVTSTPIRKHPQPVIEAAWFEEGCLACPLDFDSYWKPEAMRLADKFCTDDAEQLLSFRSEGYFLQIPSIYGDLGEIVSGKKLGRETEKERTMTVNLGVAITDIAAASKVYEIAVRKGLGVELTT